MRDHPLVLLIDDEDNFLEIASVVLHLQGFDTVITHSAHEALAKAEEILPDLILSDIYMPPGLNGWEFALQVHRDPKLKNIKFAFFSSLRDPTMEIPPSERAKILNELDGVRFFSKMDISALGLGVHELVTSR